MDPTLFNLQITPEMLTRIRPALQPGQMDIPFTTQPTDESVPWTLSQNTAPRRIGAAVIGFVGALLVVSLVGRK